MGLGVGAAWVSGGARDMAGSACPFSPAFLSGHSRAPRRGIWAPMGVMGSAGSPCVPGGIPGLLACCPHPGLPLGGRRERRPVRPPWTGHCPRCHKAHVWSSLRAGFPAGGVGPPGPELGAPGSCAHAWPLAASPPKPRWSPQRPRTRVAGAPAGPVGGASHGFGVGRRGPGPLDRPSVPRRGGACPWGVPFILAPAASQWDGRPAP